MIVRPPKAGPGLPGPGRGRSNPPARRCSLSFFVSMSPPAPRQLRGLPGSAAVSRAASGKDWQPGRRLTPLWRFESGGRKGERGLKVEAGGRLVDPSQKAPLLEWLAAEITRSVRDL